jgi:hypothetical protein
LLTGSDEELIKRVRNLPEDVIAGTHYNNADMTRRIKAYRTANNSKVAEYSVSEFFGQRGVQLLSIKDQVRFRPFVVKEQKLLIMALESGDLNTIIDTIKQVINNCVLDECDVNDLPMFDIEHIFLNIRARSIGENINLKYNCNNLVSKEDEEDEKCNNIVSIDLNILEVQPEKEEGHTNKIEITESLGLVMSYPSINILKEFNMENQSDSIMDMTVSCIDYIFSRQFCTSIFALEKVFI